MASKPEPQTIEMTAEQAADAVGLPVEKVLSFKDYGTHVVVVKRNGKKLDSRKPLRAVKPEPVIQPVSTNMPGG